MEGGGKGAKRHKEVRARKPRWAGGNYSRCPIRPYPSAAIIRGNPGLQIWELVNTVRSLKFKLIKTTDNGDTESSTSLILM